MSLVKAARGSKTNHKKGILAAKRAAKRKEAEERQAKRDKLTLEQKLKSAIGKKEQQRLMAQIQERDRAKETA